MIARLIASYPLRQIYLVFGSVVFLALTAVTMLGIKPLYERYDRISWELKSLRALDYSSSTASLAPLETEVRAYERTLLGDLQNVPVRQLESHIIAALQSSAWQTEVNLLSIEPLDTLENMPYREIAFRLEIEGKYFNLDDWIASVTDQLGYVVFKEYTLRVKEQGLDPTLSARVLLAAYRVEA